MTPLAFVVSLPVRFYRLVFSPWVGHGCRYHPTCSAYGMEALRKHGGIKGTYLMIRRILRCHPWGGSGIDNVPDYDASIAPVNALFNHRAAFDAFAQEDEKP